VRLYKYLARSRWVCSSESGASPGALEDSCAVVCSPLRLVVAVPDPVVQTGSPSSSSLDLSVIAAGAFCGLVSAWLLIVLRQGSGFAGTSHEFVQTRSSVSGRFFV